MSNRLTPVRPDDLGRFMHESETCRAWLKPILRVLEQLMALNGKGIGQAIANACHQLGVSASTLRRYYDAFRHSGGDFESVIDRRQFPAPGMRSELSDEVIELWRRLCEENNRKCKPAYRRILDLWRRGEPEGIVWPPFDPVTHIPVGMTYRNLLRYRPTDFALRAMRNGLGAAMNVNGPQMLTTRVGLWVGSHFVIDDLNRDLKVLLLGNGGKIARVQELGVLDLFSADRFIVHRRPQFERADGTKDSLKEVEMRWLLARTFHGIGYSDRGTEIVAESGTATVRKAFADWLHEQSNGKITVRLPGTLGKVQALTGWQGRGGGNPRHKAALESHHNYVHNESAHLPAPTGHDRNPPEWLHGIEVETKEIMEYLRTLPLSQAAALRAQMLEYWQALSILAELDARVALRTDHELEGWLECNHTLVEHCVDLVDDRWIGPQTFLSLPQAARDRLAAAAERAPQLRRARKLSPREVFSRGAEKLVRLTDSQLAMFFTERELGDDLRRPARLTAAGMIEIQNAQAAPEPLFYQRELTARDGAESYRLEERTEYRVIQNPFDPRALWVFAGNGAFLGTAPQVQRASRLDDEAINAQLGRISHEKAQLLAPLRERHAEAAALIGEIREHNARVVAGPAAKPSRMPAAEDLAAVCEDSETGRLGEEETDDIAAQLEELS
jgi:hypothetical protein